MPGDVRIEGENLVFELLGIDKIFAFKDRVTISLRNVVSVSTETIKWHPPSRLRAGATVLPGIKDGTFVTKDGFEFYHLRNPKRCITIELENEHYRRIIFEVKDKHAVAKTIRNATSSRRAP